MTYEIYKKTKTMEEYFQTWDSENYNRLKQKHKEQIYAKHLIKCEVFQRDSFKCQNVECKYPEAKLTLHHVRFQKNGGKDSARNCITLCITCHQGYHRGKNKIVFPNENYLPSHIKGHTFGVSKNEGINWKNVKTEMKIFRKKLINERVYLTWEQIEILMNFLEMDYEDGDD